MSSPHAGEERPGGAAVGRRGIALARARVMRHEPTDAERVLWRLLRAKRLAGSKWRRQQPIGHYIVDFICLEARLIVEADGSEHLDSTHDARRDAWLRQQGFKLLRFWNNDVLARTDAVLDTILSTLNGGAGVSPTPLPCPSPARGEGEEEQGSARG